MRLLPHRPRWLLVLGLLALLVAAVGVLVTYDDPAGPRAPVATGAWVTSPDDAGRRLARLEAADPTERVTARVRVDPDDRRQVWRGTGGALTDASVELLRRAPRGVRLLFDPDSAEGAHLSWLRLPLTATDMSPRAWTWGWDGTTASPSAQARRALVTVARVRDLQPGLQVVATPWTAPKWMKQPATVRGGALRDDAADQYAELLVAQADVLRDHDVPLTAMTLANEPGYSADYPSMLLTPAQQAGLGTVVGPQLHDRGVELWAVDHNWSDRARYEEVLREAPDTFDAAAFHCYGGSPDQMAGVGVPPIVSECTGTKDTWAKTFAWDMQNLVAQSTAAGSTGLVMWNLAVDPRGGPRDLTSAAGCAACRGLLTVDRGKVAPGPEFYVLAHVARAADPGARVVASTSSEGIATAAFLNPDGTVGVVAFNGTGQDRVVATQVPGRTELRSRVGADELFTLRVRR